MQSCHWVPRMGPARRKPRTDTRIDHQYGPTAPPNGGLSIIRHYDPVGMAVPLIHIIIPPNVNISIPYSGNAGNRGLARPKKRNPTNGWHLPVVSRDNAIARMEAQSNMAKPSYPATAQNQTNRRRNGRQAAHRRPRPDPGVGRGQRHGRAVRETPAPEHAKTGRQEG